MASNGDGAAGKPARLGKFGTPMVAVGSAIVGAGLAAVAGWAIYSSATSAPGTNPANNSVVVYGNR